MKKKTWIFGCSAMILYTIFLFLTRNQSLHFNAPKMNVPDGILRVSVKDDHLKLLEGISAVDLEDGDLTNKIFVERISEFDDNQFREVTFIVFDSDDHFTRATRKIQYIDYQKPVFDIVKPLFYDAYYTEKYSDFVHATSSLDGDLSFKIIMEEKISDESGDYRIFSVTDSCGTKEKIKLKLMDVYYSPLFKIKLKKNLLRVPLGTSIDPYDYVVSIEYMKMENNGLINIMKVQDDYDPTQKGTYSFIYSVEINGDVGLNELTVIVE